jgi:putative DNA primase/helicase
VGGRVVSNLKKGNPRRDAALIYAKAGFEVFPSPPGKKQSCKSLKFSNGRPWGKSSDPVEIKRDWMRWPDANVCIATGKVSNFFVVEVDTPEGHDVDGKASLAALEAANSPLPDTRMAESPSGSIHRYFRWPENGTIKNSASELGPGIDVRGEGGMVLAPPSIKPGVGE